MKKANYRLISFIKAVFSECFSFPTVHKFAFAVYTTTSQISRADVAFVSVDFLTYNKHYAHENLFIYLKYAPKKSKTAMSRTNNVSLSQIQILRIVIKKQRYPCD